MGAKGTMKIISKRQILSTFVSDVVAKFQEVTNRFGFVIKSSEISPPDMWIIFKNDAGVELTVDFEWGGLLSLVVSKKGWSLARKGQSHNLGPLISIRAGQTSVLYHSPFMDYDSNRISCLLANAASELLTFASDVLEGDFAAFGPQK